MGGTCVNTGCIPTKTLVASARVAYLARRATEFGVQIDTPVSVDMARVKSRMDEIVAASNAGVTDWVEGMEALADRRFPYPDYYLESAARLCRELGQEEDAAQGGGMDSLAI